MIANTWQPGPHGVFIVEAAFHSITLSLRWSSRRVPKREFRPGRVESWLGWIWPEFPCSARWPVAGLRGRF